MSSRLATAVLPETPRYRRIAMAAYVVFGVFCIPIYLLPLSEIALLPIVRWIWRLNIFGVWSNTTPYYCEYYDGLDKPTTFHSGLCDYLTTTAGRPTFPAGIEPSVAYFLLFAAGTIPTIRMSVLCLQRCEEALGIDLLSRALDYFLPGKSKAPE